MNRLLAILGSVDLKRARLASGLQRGLVVIIVMWLTACWVDLGAAASTGIAALLVGFLDTQQPPSARARAMGLGTLVLAATTLVVHVLTPWPLAVLGILVLIAFSEGASIAVSRGAPKILHFCGIIAATAVLEPQPTATAVPAALAVLIAGTVQTIASTGAAVWSPHIREMDEAADAVDLIASAIQAVAGTPARSAMDPATQAALDSASRSMVNARKFISSSDLAREEREGLEQALWTADQLRVEAKALALHASAEGGGPSAVDDDRVRAELHEAARVLRVGAAALRSPRSERVTEARRLGTTLSAAAPGAAEAFEVDVSAREFTTDVIKVLQVRHGRGRSEVTWRLRWERIRSAVQPGTLPFRLGLRIVVASVVAIGIGYWTGLVHASWAVNSSLSIFRPDGGATLSRIVLRALAATLGGFTVVAAAVAFDASTGALAAVAAVFILLTYCLGPVNYGVFGFFMTVAVLSILAVTGENPEIMAIARWQDTLLGCLVSLAVAFAMPIWQVQNLPANVSSSCGTVARWFSSLAEAARQQPGARDMVGVRKKGVAVRDSISDVITTLRAAQVEPSRGVQVAALTSTFEDLRRCARQAVVAEQLLRQAAPLSAVAADRAEATARTLDRIARSVVGDMSSVEEPLPPKMAASPDGQLAAVMAHAAELAQEALQAQPRNAR